MPVKNTRCVASVLSANRSCSHSLPSLYLIWEHSWLWNLKYSHFTIKVQFPTRVICSRYGVFMRLWESALAAASASAPASAPTFVNDVTARHTFSSRVRNFAFWRIRRTPSSPGHPQGQHHSSHRHGSQNSASDQQQQRQQAPTSQSTAPANLNTCGGNSAAAGADGYAASGNFELTESGSCGNEGVEDVYVFVFSARPFLQTIKFSVWGRQD